jgi:hypothetical protein
MFCAIEWVSAICVWVSAICDLSAICVWVSAIWVCGCLRFVSSHDLGVGVCDLCLSVRLNVL